MASNHLIIGEESVWGTYVTPTLAIPVRSANIAASQPLMNTDETGGGRGMTPGRVGEVGATGNATMTLHPTMVGKLLASTFGTRAAVTPISGTPVTITGSSVASPTVVTTTGAHSLVVNDIVTIAGHTGSTPTINGSFVVLSVPSGTTFTIGVTVTVGGTGGTVTKGRTGYNNKLLPNDEIPFESFSMQQKYSNTLAQFTRGAKVTGWNIGANAREFATIGFDFVAKDVTVSGGTWSDGTTAPATPVPIPPYPTNIPSPFTFYEGVIRLGGAVSMVAGELVVTGGTPSVGFDNITLSAAYNLSTDAYSVNMGDRTVASIDEGTREITVGFAPNFAISGAEFWIAWKAASRAVIELWFKSTELINTANYHEMHIVLPYVQYASAGLPDVTQTYGLQRTPIEGQAKVDPNLGVDIGVTLKTLDDLT